MSDREFWKSGGSAGVLTPQLLELAAEMTRAKHGGPHIEYHHPQCPKILTNAEKACRCGAAPLEAVFEDANEVPGLP